MIFFLSFQPSSTFKKGFDPNSFIQNCFDQPFPKRLGGG
jgi:hypothetical protein